MKKIVTQEVIMTAMLFAVCSAVHALPFTITPKSGYPLPIAITPGQTTTALYTITNNTSSIRTQNSIRYLPPFVSQVLSNSNYPDLCGETFTLGPSNTVGDSCTLQLLISGAVNAADPDPHHHLFACFPGGKTCAGTPNPLDVAIVPVENVMAAGGYFANLNTGFALGIQTTLNEGVSWTQRTVPLIDALQQAAVFSMDCNDGACLGSARYVDNNYNNYAGIVSSSDNGSTWSQQLLIAPTGFYEQALNGISCIGPTCHAVGSVVGIGSGRTLPLIATSTNSGATWSQQIIQNLPDDYTTSEMKGVSCAGGSCFAAGYFQNDTINKPGILSSSNGTTWSSIVLTLPTGTSGSLSGISCSGSLCVAVGAYQASTATLYYTTDSGASWQQLPSDLSFTPYTFTQFSGVSCTSGLCVAVGYGTTPPASNNPHVPILAVSTNGTSWTPQVLTIPTDYTHCELNGVHCENNNTCIAVGSCSNNASQILDLKPITAISRDGGANWTIQVQPLPVNEAFGELFAVG